MNDLPKHMRELAEQFNEGSEAEVTLRVAADELERLRRVLDGIQKLAELDIDNEQESPNTCQIEADARIALG